MGTGDEIGVDAETAADLARSLRALLQAAEHRLTSSDPSPLVSMITDHIGCPLSQIPNVAARWPGWEHANLQRGIDAYLAEHSPDAAWFGVGGPSRGYQDVIDMLATAEQQGTFLLGAVDYASVAIGPDRSMDAVQLGLVRTVAPDGIPVVLAVRGVPEHPEPACALQVLAAQRATGTAVRERIEQLMREHDVFRGQVLMFGFSEHRSNQLVTFQPRPALTADEVILPAGVLETIEQHAVLAGGRAEALLSAGQHLKRGLLLHGPPGTGKTHTVRYLMSRLPDYTVIVISGPALPLIGHAAALARRLQPAIIVVEDVDLIAAERIFGPFGGTGHPLLFQLLNEIDGVNADADVTFVLTTNRVEVLEHALIDRPGRIDLAVHIPRPDAECRLRLLRLYAAQVTLDLPDPEPLVRATEGVTASFVRELVRRAVLRLIEQGASDPIRLDEATLRAALAELANERNTLTRSILGGQPADEHPAPDQPPFQPLPAYSAPSWIRTVG